MTSRKLFLFALLFSAFGPATHALADPPSNDEHYTAEQLTAQGVFGPDHQSKFELWSGPGFRVQYNQRNGPGEVEVHVRINDIFVIEEGHATMILGGTVEGGRETAPNERRGGKIVDGHERALSPGDVVWVPAGEPHQIIPSGNDAFRYEVIKVEARLQ